MYNDEPPRRGGGLFCIRILSVRFLRASLRSLVILASSCVGLKVSRSSHWVKFFLFLKLNVFLGVQVSTRGGRVWVE